MKPSLQITALVPMRHFSERVPQKNYRPFSGKPLFYYVIESLLGCPQIKKIIINTDSPTIKQEVRANFKQVQINDRPSHLVSDKIPMNEILLHDVQMEEEGYFLQTHSTNPLLTSKTIGKAIEAFFSALPKIDSLFSITHLQTRLWNREIQPINHNPSELVRTQDLEPLFEENSCLYLFSKQGLIKNKNRIGSSPLFFEMDKIEATDIDEEVDFQVAEALHTSLRQR